MRPFYLSKVKFENRNSILSGSDSLRPLSIDEDDELLQYAIQQSLMEAGSEEDQVIYIFIYSFFSFECETIIINGINKY